jgi:type I restriction enzyme S subunit
MKKYDNYKDSGIEWLGEIPNHWKVTKLKFIGDAIGGLTYAPNNVVENESQGVLVLRSSNIQNGKLSLNDNVFVNLEISEKLTLKKGDILICSRNGSQHLIGKNICIDERTEGSTFGAFMMIFRSKNYGFLNQYFNSPIFTSQSGLFLTATINQLTSGTLNNFYIAIPETIEEQNAIANYLDHKTNQIDTLISKKEKFINLLQEERIAVINQAVTKGLDPNVPMKDSGIEGLNLIPSSWELLKFKWFAPILTCGVASTPEYVDKSIGMPFLSAQNVKNNQMRLDNFKYISIDLHNSLTKSRKPQNGDLLVTRVGAGIGDACIVDCDFEFSVYVSLTHIRVDDSIVNNKFIMYFFSTDYCKFLNSQGTVTGGGVGNLNVNNVERYKVPIPPLKEQEKIVDYISGKSSEIDRIIFKTKQEIELLKEYKTTLISEVVTGKVDVREEVLN